MALEAELGQPSPLDPEKLALMLIIALGILCISASAQVPGGQAPGIVYHSSTWLMAETKFVTQKAPSAYVA